MNNLIPQAFFDLSQFDHSSLFLWDEPVWKSLGRIQKYLEEQKLGVIEGVVEDNVYLANPELISIGKGSVVEAGAYIRGPCIIGKNCQVRSGAYIRGYLIAGDNCVIGHSTEVKNSIFLDGAKAGHFAYIGDSILGNRVNLGAGTKCANLRLDRNSIKIFYETKRIDTGLKKMGAILGDGAQTGCNSVTNPGTLMEKESCCLPCENIGGFTKVKPVFLTKSQAVLLKGKDVKIKHNSK